MSVFRHPHLTRGIVKTAKGSFIVKRGLVDVPDEIGDALGWQPIDTDGEYERGSSALSAPDYEEAAGNTEASAPTSNVNADRDARGRMIRAKAASRRARLDAQSAE
jgi:hypothetical protein